MSKLTDKIIIVTGGNGLIGKGIVEKLKFEGAIVINADINLETTDDLQNIKCDITDAASIQSLVDKIVAKYGRIDGLVNNAYPRTKDWGAKFEDITTDSWIQNINLQMTSYIIFCQIVLKQMVIQESGCIVNLGSTYGVVAPDFTVYDGTLMTSAAPYAAIKGGIINFTRYIASYFGKYGIRANSVSPGGIFDNQNPVFVKNYEHKVPLKRMGNPSDIAGPVSFLLSDDSAYVTGHNLMADGGWTAI
jgi:NAD(P)-dependent dehydrogenase (short-subunit alcohol dehydrogenase family)